MTVGIDRRFQDVNDNEADVLNLNWQGRLMDYCYHRNDEHCEALVNEIYSYYADRLERYLPLKSSWRRASVSHAVAAILIMWDRGLVDRSIDEFGMIIIKINGNAEELLLGSVELLPLAEPFLELLGALRRQAASLAEESA
jgi:hypothetical protein